MAIITSSIAYSGKNKLGTMVLKSVKGQLIASQYQPQVFNPRTVGQVNQRSKLSIIVKSYRTVRNIVESVLINPNRHGSKYNKFVQLNVEGATVFTNNEWRVRYADLLMCEGSLSPIENITQTVNAGVLTFDYQGQQYANDYTANDVIYGGIYFPEIEDSFLVEISTRGVNGTATINLTGLTAGIRGHIVVMANNAQERQTSKSQYLGFINI